VTDSGEKIRDLMILIIDSNDSALILMQRMFMLMIMNNGLYQEVCTISPLALFWSRMDFQINDLQLS